MPLDFRALVDLGCLCVVDKAKARELASGNTTDLDTFELEWLQFKTLAHYHYLPEKGLKKIYFYHHKVGHKALFGLFVPGWKKADVFVVDTVRSNQMPALKTLYNNERNSALNSVQNDDETDPNFPESDYEFSIRVETDLRQVYRQIQRSLTTYKDEKKGPTVIMTQSSTMDTNTLISAMPVMAEFPFVPIHVTDSDTLYNVLDWQRLGARTMIKHFLRAETYFT